MLRHESEELRGTGRLSVVKSNLKVCGTSATHMFLEVPLRTVKTSASLDIPFLGGQDSARFLGLVGGESRWVWDFDADLFEREIFWRRQTTTQRDETYSSQHQHFAWTNIASMKRSPG